jgi:hypothetical protein
MSQEQWETGVIQYTLERQGCSRPRARFSFEVVGPRGRYTAAETEPFTYPDEGDRDGRTTSESMPDSMESMTAFHQLLRKIYHDGWELVGHDRLWYALRFRRRA